MQQPQPDTAPKSVLRDIHHLLPARKHLKNKHKTPSIISDNKRTPIRAAHCSSHSIAYSHANQPAPLPDPSVPLQQRDDTLQQHNKAS